MSAPDIGPGALVEALETIVAPDGQTFITRGTIYRVTEVRDYGAKRCSLPTCAGWGVRLVGVPERCTWCQNQPAWICGDAIKPVRGGTDEVVRQIKERATQLSETSIEVLGEAVRDAQRRGVRVWWGGRTDGKTAGGGGRP